MPLTAKGEEIKSALTKEYGEAKGEQVLYAGKNKGTFTGIDAQNSQSKRTTESLRKSLQTWLPAETRKEIEAELKRRGESKLDSDMLARIADCADRLSARLDAMVDADNKWYVQFKTKDKLGKEYTEARNVTASTASEAERKAKEKDKHPEHEFVRFLSARQGPAGYGS